MSVTAFTTAAAPSLHGARVGLVLLDCYITVAEVCVWSTPTNKNACERDSVRMNASAPTHLLACYVTCLCSRLPPMLMFVPTLSWQLALIQGRPCRVSTLLDTCHYIDACCCQCSRLPRIDNEDTRTMTRIRFSN